MSGIHDSGKRSDNRPLPPAPFDLLAQEMHAFGSSLRALVRAIVRDGVEHVHDPDDLCHDRDLVAA
jgi:hypothetical protein